MPNSSLLGQVMRLASSARDVIVREFDLDQLCRHLNGAVHQLLRADPQVVACAKGGGSRKDKSAATQPA
jgi:hypothetical protein